MYRATLLHRKKLRHDLRVHAASTGFTLIEFVIVVAVIAIILTLALPSYSNYSARMKVAESLSVAAAAKTAVASACQADLTIPSLTNQLAGYDFQATKYVLDIQIAGPCTTPTITMTTQATGLQPSPVLTITGNFISGAGSIDWVCVSNGLNVHVPETCRS